MKLFKLLMAASIISFIPLATRYSDLALAQQRIMWNATASNLRNNLDQDFRFDCPPNGKIHTIWGTEVYTHGSSICSAAVHMGLITTRDGGRVTIRIRPGAEFYNGTTRNGVRSGKLGSYDGSFIFIGSNGRPLVRKPYIRLISWNDNAVRWRGRLDQDFTLDCPPNGSIGTIWGTDIYTYGSSICSAAVHAGLITARDGGRVTIRIRPGAESYNGTTRNGVRSGKLGSYDGSFIFIRQ